MKETWNVLPDSDEVARFALNIILETSKKAIETSGVFRIVLAGGTTPEKVYQLLSAQSCDWSKWQIYLGDERCLPVDHEERNSQMVVNALLRHIEIPEANIHFIPAETGSEEAAANYTKVIDGHMPFDLVMLGMGEDGHTASLFPGHHHNEQEWIHPVKNSPKPPAERVSMSVKALGNNRHLMIMVTGKAKREALEQWKNGESLPISRITSLEQKTVLLDRPVADV